MVRHLCPTQEEFFTCQKEQASQTFLSSPIVLYVCLYAFAEKNLNIQSALSSLQSFYPPVAAAILGP